MCGKGCCFRSIGAILRDVATGMCGSFHGDPVSEFGDSVGNVSGASGLPPFLMISKRVKPICCAFVVQKVLIICLLNGSLLYDA